MKTQKKEKIKKIDLAKYMAIEKLSAYFYEIGLKINEIISYLNKK